MKVRHCFSTVCLFVVILLGCVSCSKAIEVEDSGNKNNPSVPDELKEWVTEDVICLSDKQKAHIAGCTQGELYFNADTPDELLPTQRQIILENKLSDVFPAGFYGRVAQVNKTDGRITVKTEWAPLSEAFKAIPRQTFDLSDYITGFVQADGTEVPVRKETSNTKAGFWETVTVEMNKGGCSLTGTIKLRAKLDVSGDDIKYFKVGLDYDIDGELKVDYTMEKGFDTKPIKIGEYSFRAIPATVVLTPVVVVYARVDGSGKISLSASLKPNLKMAPYLQYKNDKLECGFSNSPISTLAFSLLDLDMEVELNQSLSFELQIRLFNYENIRIALGTRFKFTEAAKFSLNLSAISELQNGKAYASLKENGLSCVFNANIYAEVAVNLLFKGDKDTVGINGDIGVSAIPEIPLLQRKILPSFDNLTFKVQQKQHQATFTYHCFGQLFADNIRMGYALYRSKDESEQPLRMVLEDGYYTQDDMKKGKTFSFTVEDLEEGIDYCVRPVFEIFEKKVASDDYAEHNALVGKWMLTEEVETYIDSNGSPQTNRCHHPVIYEFKSDSTGVIIGMHYGVYEVTPDTPEDNGETWHPEAKIFFKWEKNDQQVIIENYKTENVPDGESWIGLRIGAVIGDLTNDRLVFSYSADKSFWVMTCKRIE